MRPLALLPLLPLLVACPPKAGSGDESGAAPEDTGGSSGDGQQVAVMTTVSMDYAVGSLATVALDGWASAAQLTATTGDSTVVVEEGLVYVLNRYGYDTVRVYEPGAFSAPTLEFSVGSAGASESANPYDVALCGGHLFVSLYGRDWLGVYDPDTGVLTGTVDLSEFSDGDEVGPEPGAMTEVDGRLYVGMNRLDRAAGWTDAGGMVAEVDCEAKAVTASWEVGGNAAIVDWSGEDRVLVLAREYGEMAGGLYAVDPAADTVALLVRADGLGGTVSSVAPFGDQAIVTSLASDYASYGIYCADLATGAATALESTSQYLTTAAANDRGEAWVGAHWGWTDPDNAEPGVRVFDIASCAERTTAPIDVVLAPLDIAFY